MEQTDNYKNPIETDITEEEQFLVQFLNHSFKLNQQDEEPFTKQNTHQANYEGILKQIQDAKVYQNQLKQQLQTIKHQVTKDALKGLLRELAVLSKENYELRLEYKEVSKKSVRFTSPHQTPRYLKKQQRARRRIESMALNKNTNCAQSKISVYDFNSSSKKQRKSFQDQCRMMKSQASLCNLDQIFSEQARFGRGSLPNHRPFISKNSSIIQNNLQKLPGKVNWVHKADNSFCLSEINANYSIEKSAIHCYSSFNQDISNNNAPNMFLDFIATMVQEEKDREREILQDINMGVNYQLSCGSSFISDFTNKAQTIEDLHRETQYAHQRIQKLEQLYQLYEKEVKQMNLDIDITTQVSQQIIGQSGRRIAMQRQVSRGISLQKQVKSKEFKYKKVKQKMAGQKTQNALIPNSLKAAIMILNGKSVSTLKQCYHILMEGVKNPQKFRLGRQEKHGKTLQLTQSIKQGRAKFNQLMEIYNVRINKLEERIKKIDKKNKILTD